MLLDLVTAVAGPSSLPLLVELGAAGLLALGLFLRRPVTRALRRRSPDGRRPAVARIRRA